MLTDVIVPATTLAGREEWHGGPGPWWPIFPILWFLIVISALITGFVLVRRRHRSGPTRSGAARLAERFAAGEIDEDEYRTRLAVLRERT